MAADMAKGFAVFAGVAPEIIRASAREAEARGSRSRISPDGATRSATFPARCAR